MVPARLDFKLLKRVVSVERVLAAEGLSAGLKRRGRRLTGPCPLHGGDNPTAFVVELEKNLWHCFTRCGGGDVVELARRLQSGSYRQAAEHLAALAAGGAAPPADPAPAPRPVPPFRPFRRRLRLDPTADLLRSKGIEPATARRFEAGAYDGPGFCQGCLALRLHDPRGQPLGYAARRLDPEQARRHGKWKLPPRLPKRRLLYGYHRSAPIIAEQGVVLVECPWGVMRLAQLGLPAVALLGTHLSEPQRALLAAAPRILLMLDGDPAGRRATRILRKQLRPFTTVRLVHLPDAHDPDDLTDAQLWASASPLLA